MEVLVALRRAQTTTRGLCGPLRAPIELRRDLEKDLGHAWRAAAPESPRWGKHLRRI